MSRKKKVRSEKGRERAIELEGRLEMRLKERDERKVGQTSTLKLAVTGYLKGRELITLQAKRLRAKKAWE